MSPVARGPRMTARSAIVVGVAGIAAGVVLLLFVLWAAGRGGDVKVKLGDDVFSNIVAVNTAEKIKADGPILFSDVSGGSRDVIVQHLGPDALTNWYAFDARVPGSSRDCFAKWDKTVVLFVDSCDASKTFSAKGEGLRQYPVKVTDGRVVIDFNPATTTTTAAP